MPDRRRRQNNSKRLCQLLLQSGVVSRFDLAERDKWLYP